jgi:hypothetical protein
MTSDVLISERATKTYALLLSFIDLKIGKNLFVLYCLGDYSKYFLLYTDTKKNTNG